MDNKFNFNNIKTSPLQFNDKFKFIQTLYNNKKIYIKTPLLKNKTQKNLHRTYDIQKLEDHYLLNINLNLLDFEIFNQIQTYIFNKAIKELKKWFYNVQFLIENTDNLLSIKLYNNIKLKNNSSLNINSIDDIYNNFLINNLEFNLVFQICGVWIEQIDNNIIIYLYLKSSYIEF